MPRRGEHDRDKERFWRRMVRQWRRSGLTVRDFCDQHGLAEPSFYAWRRTMAERDLQAGRRRCRDGNGRADHAPAFLPVRVVPAAAASPAPLEVVLGQGRVVRVPPGFDAAALRQLLAVLEEGPSC